MKKRKRCGTCRKLLPINTFNVNPIQRDGLQPNCVPCDIEWSQKGHENKTSDMETYAKQYYVKNRDRIRRYQKEYYLRNQERLKANQDKWRNENKEHQSTYNAEYYLKNKERIKAQRKSRRGGGLTH